MIDKAGLKVAEPLARFIDEEALPGTGLASMTFWQGVADIFARFAPDNAALLAERDRLQAAIDAWHRTRVGEPFDAHAYQSFLRKIGYLVDEPPSFAIAPDRVDAEVATCAGPQLVVPALNARFVLNAANARWGSLYDALYGTDALPDPAAGRGYDAARGARGDRLGQGVSRQRGSPRVGRMERLCGRRTRAGRSGTARGKHG